MVAGTRGRVMVSQPGRCGRECGRWVGGVETGWPGRLVEVVVWWWSVCFPLCVGGPTFPRCVGLASGSRLFAVLGLWLCWVRCCWCGLGSLL